MSQKQSQVGGDEKASSSDVKIGDATSEHQLQKATAMMSPTMEKEEIVRDDQTDESDASPMGMIRKSRGAASPPPHPLPAAADSDNNHNNNERMPTLIAPLTNSLAADAERGRAVTVTSSNKDSCTNNNAAEATIEGGNNNNSGSSVKNGSVTSVGGQASSTSPVVSTVAGGSPPTVAATVTPAHTSENSYNTATTTSPQTHNNSGTTQTSPATIGDSVMTPTTANTTTATTPAQGREEEGVSPPQCSSVNNNTNNTRVQQSPPSAANEDKGFLVGEGQFDVDEEDGGGTRQADAADAEGDGGGGRVGADVASSLIIDDALGLGLSSVLPVMTERDAMAAVRLAAATPSNATSATTTPVDPTSTASNNNNNAITAAQMTIGLLANTITTNTNGNGNSGGTCPALTVASSSVSGGGGGGSSSAATTPSASAALLPPMPARNGNSGGQQHVANNNNTTFSNGSTPTTITACSPSTTPPSTGTPSPATNATNTTNRGLSPSQHNRSQTTDNDNNDNEEGGGSNDNCEDTGSGNGGGNRGSEISGGGEGGGGGSSGGGNYCNGSGHTIHSHHDEKRTNTDSSRSHKKDDSSTNGGRLISDTTAGSSTLGGNTTGTANRSDDKNNKTQIGTPSGAGTSSSPRHESGGGGGRSARHQSSVVVSATTTDQSNSSKAAHRSEEGDSTSKGGGSDDVSNLQHSMMPPYAAEDHNRSFHPHTPSQQQQRQQFEYNTQQYYNKHANSNNNNANSINATEAPPTRHHQNNNNTTNNGDSGTPRNGSKERGSGGAGEQQRGGGLDRSLGAMSGEPSGEGVSGGDVSDQNNHNNNNSKHLMKQHGGGGKGQSSDNSGTSKRMVSDDTNSAGSMGRSSYMGTEYLTSGRSVLTLRGTSTSDINTNPGSRNPTSSDTQNSKIRNGIGNMLNLAGTTTSSDNNEGQLVFNNNIKLVKKTSSTSKTSEGDNKLEKSKFHERFSSDPRKRNFTHNSHNQAHNNEAKALSSKRREVGAEGGGGGKDVVGKRRSESVERLRSPKESRESKRNSSSHQQEQQQQQLPPRATSRDPSDHRRRDQQQKPTSPVRGANGQLFYPSSSSTNRANTNNDNYDYYLPQTAAGAEGHDPPAGGRGINGYANASSSGGGGGGKPSSNPNGGGTATVSSTSIGNGNASTVAGANTNTNTNSDSKKGSNGNPQQPTAPASSDHHHPEDNDTSRGGGGGGRTSTSDGTAGNDKVSSSSTQRKTQDSNSTSSSSKKRAAAAAAAAAAAEEKEKERRRNLPHRHRSDSTHLVSISNDNDNSPAGGAAAQKQHVGEGVANDSSKIAMTHFSVDVHAGSSSSGGGAGRRGGGEGGGAAADGDFLSSNTSNTLKPSSSSACAGSNALPAGVGTDGGGVADARLGNNNIGGGGGAVANNGSSSKRGGGSSTINNCNNNVNDNGHANMQPFRCKHVAPDGHFVHKDADDYVGADEDVWPTSPVKEGGLHIRSPTKVTQMAPPAEERGRERGSAAVTTTLRGMIGPDGNLIPGSIFDPQAAAYYAHGNVHHASQQQQQPQQQVVGGGSVFSGSNNKPIINDPSLPIPAGISFSSVGTEHHHTANATSSVGASGAIDNTNNVPLHIHSATSLVEPEGYEASTGTVPHHHQQQYGGLYAINNNTNMNSNSSPLSIGGGGGVGGGSSPLGGGGGTHGQQQPHHRALPRGPKGHSALNSAQIPPSTRSQLLELQAVLQQVLGGEPIAPSGHRSSSRSRSSGGGVGTRSSGGGNTKGTSSSDGANNTTSSSGVNNNNTTTSSISSRSSGSFRNQQQQGGGQSATPPDLGGTLAARNGEGNNLHHYHHHRQGSNPLGDLFANSAALLRGGGTSPSRAASDRNNIINALVSLLHGQLSVEADRTPSSTPTVDPSSSSQIGNNTPAQNLNNNGNIMLSNVDRNIMLDDGHMNNTYDYHPRRGGGGGGNIHSNNTKNNAAMARDAFSRNSNTTSGGEVSNDTNQIEANNNNSNNNNTATTTQRSCDSFSLSRGSQRTYTTDGTIDVMDGETGNVSEEILRRRKRQLLNYSGGSGTQQLDGFGVRLSNDGSRNSREDGAADDSDGREQTAELKLRRTLNDLLKQNEKNGKHWGLPSAAITKGANAFTVSPHGSAYKLPRHPRSACSANFDTESKDSGFQRIRASSNLYYQKVVLSRVPDTVNRRPKRRGPVMATTSSGTTHHATASNASREQNTTGTDIAGSGESNLHGVSQGGGGAGRRQGTSGSGGGGVSGASSNMAPLGRNMLPASFGSPPNTNTHRRLLLDIRDGELGDSESSVKAGGSGTNMSGGGSGTNASGGGRSFGSAPCNTNSSESRLTGKSSLATDGGSSHSNSNTNTNTSEFSAHRTLLSSSHSRGSAPYNERQVARRTREYQPPHRLSDSSLPVMPIVSMQQHLTSVMANQSRHSAAGRSAAAAAVAAVAMNNSVNSATTASGRNSVVGNTSKVAPMATSSANIDNDDAPANNFVDSSSNRRQSGDAANNNPNNSIGPQQQLQQQQTGLPNDNSMVGVKSGGGSRATASANTDAHTAVPPTTTSSLAAPLYRNEQFVNHANNATASSGAIPTNVAATTGGVQQINAAGIVDMLLNGIASGGGAPQPLVSQPPLSTGGQLVGGGPEPTTLPTGLIRPTSINASTAMSPSFFAAGGGGSSSGGIQISAGAWGASGSPPAMSEQQYREQYQLQQGPGAAGSPFILGSSHPNPGSALLQLRVQQQSDTSSTSGNGGAGRHYNYTHNGFDATNSQVETQTLANVLNLLQHVSLQQQQHNPHQAQSALAAPGSSLDINALANSLRRLLSENRIQQQQQHNNSSTTGGSSSTTGGGGGGSSGGSLNTMLLNTTINSINTAGTLSSSGAEQQQQQPFTTNGSSVRDAAGVMATVVAAASPAAPTTAMPMTTATTTTMASPSNELPPLHPVRHVPSQRHGRTSAGSTGSSGSASGSGGGGGQHSGSGGSNNNNNAASSQQQQQQQLLILAQQQLLIQQQQAAAAAAAVASQPTSTPMASASTAPYTSQITSESLRQQQSAMGGGGGGGSPFEIMNTALTAMMTATVAAAADGGSSSGGGAHTHTTTTTANNTFNGSMPSEDESVGTGSSAHRHHHRQSSSSELRNQRRNSQLLPSSTSHTESSSTSLSLSHQQAEIGQLQEQFFVLQRTFRDLTGQCSRVLTTLANERQRVSDRENLIKARVAAQAQNNRTRRIRVNVGGSKFTFSESALSRFPGCYLEVIANDDGYNVERDEDGSLFIDRDPHAFRDILHFIRGGDMNALRSRTTSELKILIAEARYFGIDELVMELNCVRYHWFCESEYGYPTVFGPTTVRGFRRAIGDAVTTTATTSSDPWSDNLTLGTAPDTASSSSAQTRQSDGAANVAAGGGGGGGGSTPSATTNDTSPSNNNGSIPRQLPVTLTGSLAQAHINEHGVRRRGAINNTGDSSSPASTASSGDTGAHLQLQRAPTVRGMKVVTGTRFSARCFATAVVVDATTAYIFGGCAANDVFFNDLTKLAIHPVAEEEYRRHMMTHFGTGVYEELEHQADFQAREGSQHHRPIQQAVHGHLYASLNPNALPSGALLQPYRPESYHFEPAPNKGSELSARESAQRPDFATNSSSNSRTAAFNNNNNNTSGSALVLLRPPHHHHSGGGGDSHSNTSGSSTQEGRSSLILGPRAQPSINTYLGMDILNPTARTGHTMVCIKNHLVTFYGNVHDSHVDSIEAYNLGSCTWIRLKILGDPVTARSGHTTTVIGANTTNPLILLIGGKQFFPEVKRLPEIFVGDIDFAHGCLTWTKAEITALAPFDAFFPQFDGYSFVRNHHGPASTASPTTNSNNSQNLTAFTGSNQSGSRNTRINGTTNTNTNGSSSQHPGTNTIIEGAGSVAGSHSTGGSSGGVLGNAPHHHSGGGGDRGLVGTQMMQQVANRLLQRSYHTAVCYKDRYVYIFGGISDDAYSNDLLELDTKRFTLKLIKGSPRFGDLFTRESEDAMDQALLGVSASEYAPEGYAAPVPRSGHVATIHGDSMYIVGSYGADGAADGSLDGGSSLVVQLHQFKIPEQMWTVVRTSGRAPAQRAAPAVCMFPANAAHGVLPKITIMGGYSVEHNNCYSDVLTMYI